MCFGLVDDHDRLWTGTAETTERRNSGAIKRMDSNETESQSLLSKHERH